MALKECLFDAKFSGRLILALQRAVSCHFNETDWMELGYQTGEQGYIRWHAHHLLRSPAISRNTGRFKR
ncbi:MAG: hypothetical protein ACOZCP_09795 [Pseudomonadota bacterium]